MSFYWGSLAFFTLLFFVFLCVAVSVMLGVRDNYRRYYQKAELQWTGPGRKASARKLPFAWLLLAAVALALIVVEAIVP